MCDFTTRSPTADLARHWRKGLGSANPDREPSPVNGRLAFRRRRGVLSFGQLRTKDHRYFPPDDACLAVRDSVAQPRHAFAGPPGLALTAFAPRFPPPKPRRRPVLAPAPSS